MSDQEKTKIFSISGLSPGTQLNGLYEVEEKIAAGGMGEVFRGHEIMGGHPVAIKVVLQEFARDETISGLFHRETRVLRDLNHPAIVRYMTSGVDPVVGRPYLVMEFVDGPSLAELLEKGPLPAQDVRVMFARLADGLHAAHQLGIIHRDISADNVILAGGSTANPKIIDFGIARLARNKTLLEGKFAGKYNFVSPEQLGLFGGEVTDASDVYSLGLLMVNALRGRPIDMDGTQVEVIEKRRSVPDISDLDPSLQPIINLMLQPNPADRDVSMLDISHWLSEGKLMSVPMRQMPTMPPAANLEVQPTAADPERGLTAGDADEGKDQAVEDQAVESHSAHAPTSVVAGEVFPSGGAGAQQVTSIADSILPLSAPLQQTPAEPPPKEALRGRGGRGRSALIASSVLLFLMAGGVAGGWLTGYLPPHPAPKTQEADAPALTPSEKTAAQTPPTSDKGSAAQHQEAAIPQQAPQQANEAKDASAIIPQKPAAPVLQPSPPKPAPPAPPQPLPTQPAVSQPATGERPAIVEGERKPQEVAKAKGSAGTEETEKVIKELQQQITPPEVELKQLSPPPPLQPAEQKPETAAIQPQATSKAPEIASVEKPSKTNEAAAPQTVAPTLEKRPAPAVPEVAIPPAPGPDSQAKTSKEGQETAKLDTESRKFAWIKDFDGGDCFFARGISDLGNEMLIEGMGATTAPFERMDADFQSRFGSEPQIQMRPIVAKQCAVAAFLKGVGNSGKLGGTMVLDSDHVHSGESLKGTISNISQPNTVLYLIDNDGFVYQIDKYLRRQGTNGTFSIKLVELQSRDPLPQIVLSLSSDKPISAAALKAPQTAAEFLPKLFESIKREGPTVQFAFAFFKLGG